MKGLTVRITIATAALAGLLALGAVPAFATHVNCGDVITEDTTLDSDLVDCPGNGIVIGAAGITLDLAGHTVDGDGSGGFDVGVSNFGGYDGVVIEQGTVREFNHGVRIQFAATNVVRDLLISASRNGDGVSLELSNGGTIEDNEVVLAEEGIRVFRTSDVRVAGNEISGSEFGMDIFFDTDRLVIEKNVVVDSRAEGISLVTRDSIMSKNTIAGGASIGVDVLNTYDTVLEKNVISGNLRWGLLMVDSDGNSIEKNEASANGLDGLRVVNGVNTVASNTANDNGDLGIEVDPGTIDGGGNTARGNGHPAQCLGVTCK